MHPPRLPTISLIMQARRVTSQTVDTGELSLTCTAPCGKPTSRHLLRPSPRSPQPKRRTPIPNPCLRRRCCPRLHRQDHSRLAHHPHPARWRQQRSQALGGTSPPAVYMASHVRKEPRKKNSRTPTVRIYIYSTRQLIYHFCVGATFMFSQNSVFFVTSESSSICEKLSAPLLWPASTYLHFCVGVAGRSACGREGRWVEVPRASGLAENQRHQAVEPADQGPFQRTFHELRAEKGHPLEEQVRATPVVPPREGFRGV